MSDPHFCLQDERNPDISSPQTPVLMAQKCPKPMTCKIQAFSPVFFFFFRHPPQQQEVLARPLKFLALARLRETPSPRGRVPGPEGPEEAGNLAGLCVAGRCLGASIFRAGPRGPGVPFLGGMWGRESGHFWRGNSKSTYEETGAPTNHPTGPASSGVIKVGILVGGVPQPTTCGVTLIVAKVTCGQLMWPFLKQG